MASSSFSLLSDSILFKILTFVEIPELWFNVSATNKRFFKLIRNNYFFSNYHREMETQSQIAGQTYFVYTANQWVHNIPKENKRHLYAHLAKTSKFKRLDESQVDFLNERFMFADVVSPKQGPMSKEKLIQSCVQIQLCLPLPEKLTSKQMKQMDAQGSTSNLIQTILEAQQEAPAAQEAEEEEMMNPELQRRIPRMYIPIYMMENNQFTIFVSKTDSTVILFPEQESEDDERMDLSGAMMKTVSNSRSANVFYTVLDHLGFGSMDDDATIFAFLNTYRQAILHPFQHEFCPDSELVFAKGVETEEKPFWFDMMIHALKKKKRIKSFKAFEQDFATFPVPLLKTLLTTQYDDSRVPYAFLKFAEANHVEGVQLLLLNRLSKIRFLIKDALLIAIESNSVGTTKVLFSTILEHKTINELEDDLLYRVSNVEIARFIIGSLKEAAGTNQYSNEFMQLKQFAGFINMSNHYNMNHSVLHKFVSLQFPVDVIQSLLELGADPFIYAETKYPVIIGENHSVLWRPSDESCLFSSETTQAIGQKMLSSVVAAGSIDAFSSTNQLPENSNVNSFKITIVGFPGCGATELVSAFAAQPVQKEDAYTPFQKSFTLENYKVDTTTVAKIEISVENAAYSFHYHSALLQQFVNKITAPSAGNQCILLAYDVTNSNSTNGLKMLNLIKQKLSQHKALDQTTLGIVGLKLQESGKRQVLRFFGKQFAQENKTLFFEAKTTSTEDFANVLTQVIRHNFYKKEAISNTFSKEIVDTVLLESIKIIQQKRTIQESEKSLLSLLPELLLSPHVTSAIITELFEDKSGSKLQFIFEMLFTQHLISPVQVFKKLLKGYFEQLLVSMNVAAVSTTSYEACSEFLQKFEAKLQQVDNLLRAKVLFRQDSSMPSATETMSSSVLLLEPEEEKEPLTFEQSLDKWMESRTNKVFYEHLRKQLLHGLPESMQQKLKDIVVACTDPKSSDDAAIFKSWKTVLESVFQLFKFDFRALFLNYKLDRKLVPEIEQAWLELLQSCFEGKAATQFTRNMLGSNDMSENYTKLFYQKTSNQEYAAALEPIVFRSPLHYSPSQQHFFINTSSAKKSSSSTNESAALLSDAMKEYQQIFTSATQSKMSWLATMGSAVVTMNTGNQSYFLKVSSLQMQILLLFNELPSSSSGELTIGEIRQKLAAKLVPLSAPLAEEGISVESTIPVISNVAPLIANKILLLKSAPSSAPSSPGGTSSSTAAIAVSKKTKISDSSILQFNSNFTSTKKKIIIH